MRENHVEKTILLYLYYLQQVQEEKHLHLQTHIHSAVMTTEERFARILILNRIHITRPGFRSLQVLNVVKAAAKKPNSSSRPVGCFFLLYFFMSHLDADPPKTFWTRGSGALTQTCRWCRNKSCLLT